MSVTSPTFFESAPTPTDPRILNHIHRSLHISLRLPRTSRSVSDWLFTNLLETPFHKNLTLPPPHLQSTLAIQINHQVVLPTSIPSETGIETRSVNLAFIPVSNIDDVTVGYAVSTDTVDKPCEHVPSNPFLPPFVGRFAFDRRKNDLLMIVVGGCPKVIGLKALAWKKGICREQFTFAVPCESYSFAKLPSIVLSMLSNLEYRLEQLWYKPGMLLPNAVYPSVPPPPPQCGAPLYADAPVAPPLPEPVVLEDGSETAILSSDSDGTELGEDISFTPWPTDSLGSLQAELGGVQSPVVKQGVRELGKMLRGKFYGPSLRMDCLQVFCGQYVSTFSGRLCYLLSLAGGDVVNEVCRRFADGYYLAVLGVGVDERFFGLEALEDVVMGGVQEVGGSRLVEGLESADQGRSEGFARGVEFVGQAQVGAGGRRLAPRVVGGEGVTEVKRRGREEILEERKKRNRLSAARSNYRKQERIRKVREEVERNKVLVEELKKRREVVLMENRRLKMLVEGDLEVDMGVEGPQMMVDCFSQSVEMDLTSTQVT